MPPLFRLKRQPEWKQQATCGWFIEDPIQYLSLYIDVRHFHWHDAVSLPGEDRRQIVPDLDNTKNVFGGDEQILRSGLDNALPVTGS